MIINNSDPSDVLDGLLFVGNATCAEQRSGEFDLVVNCTKNLPLSSASSRTKFIRLPIDDDPGESLSLFQALRETDALRLIDVALSNGARCLVHCMAGEQRSAAVAACFLVARRGYDVDVAIAHVRAQRPAAFFFGIVNFERTIRMCADVNQQCEPCGSDTDCAGMRDDGTCPALP